VGEEESLVDLLNRATNPSNREDDVTAIDAFVDQIKSDKDGPQMSVRLLAHKMQSPQEREALQGLAVLDVCVQKCDARFHQEIGKFRFLNEMIKIVSPKYLGNLTTENVKNKTARLMFSWTKTLPSEPKIAEAYNMLKRQGIILEDPVAPEEAVVEAPPPPREDTLFKDEEKQKLLQRLLRSKNPEDHQAANRLIKNIVKEEEERREKGLKRMSELEKVNNNVKLLQEMVDAFTSDPSSSNADRELMKELFEECERLRPNLFKLASDADDKDESIADILKANDNLVKVLEAYQTHVASSSGSGGAVKLLDVSEGDTGAGAAAGGANSAAAPSAAADLLSDDLQTLGLDSPSTVLSAATAIKPPAASDPPLAASGAASDLASIFKTTETVAAPAAASSGTAGDLNGLLFIQPTPAATAAPSAAPSLTPSSLSQPFPPVSAPATTASSHSTSSTLASTSTSSSAPIPPNASPDWSNLSKVFSSLEPTSSAKPEVASTAASAETSVKAPTVDIFDSLPSSAATKSSAPGDADSGALLDAGLTSTGTTDAPLLQPKNTSTFASKQKDNGVDAAKESPSASKGFEDINLISRGLLENTMKEFGVAKMAPMMSLDGSGAATAASTKMTLAELQKRKEEEAKQRTQLPVMSPAGEAENKPATTPTTTIPTMTTTTTTAPSLDDVSVKLEAVQPSTTLTPLSLYDQHGLKVLLFFAQVSCYPSPDVAVAILTTMSTNTLPLKAYHFQASAGKLTPVKLEAPTAKELPPFNPILPPSAISQILLVANPNKEPVKLNFELSFTLGETSYSDLGESQEFPQTVFP